MLAIGLLLLIFPVSIQSFDCLIGHQPCGPILCYDPTTQGCTNDGNIIQCINLCNGVCYDPQSQYCLGGNNTVFCLENPSSSDCTVTSTTSITTTVVTATTTQVTPSNCGCCPSESCGAISPCSKNIDCDCLRMTINGGGLCADTVVSCKDLTACDPDNKTCLMSNTVCVDNTRCGFPVCYPVEFASSERCPPIGSQNLSTATTTTGTTAATTTTTTTTTSATTPPITTATTVTTAETTTTTTACIATGHPCVNHSDCCILYCGVNSAGRCCGVGGCCGPNSPCYSNSDCCTGYCIPPPCTTPPCLPTTIGPPGPPPIGPPGPTSTTPCIPPYCTPCYPPFCTTPAPPVGTCF